VTRELAGPSISRALREARANAELTQAQVAARLHVAVVTYKSWERGTRQVSADWLPRLAGALYVSVEELIHLATV
jgi:transcriptional regulator with XRE-family HTH domain